MQSSALSKPVWGALLLALVIYVGGFTLDQHLRTRHGPWNVAFTTGPSGAPAIRVSQPSLNLSNLMIVFDGETATNTPALVAFDAPQKPVPFGKVKFEDLTYLPGTMTFDFFGHEIELLPRTLYINRKSRPWQSNSTLILDSADKPRFLPDRNAKMQKP